MSTIIQHMEEWSRPMVDQKEMFRTDAEKSLAKVLQGKKLSFQHNQVVAGYEVDFWFPEFRLVIEVDGFTHLSSERRKSDRHKDQMLMDQGVVVLRISNQQIRDHITDCLRQIEGTIQRIKEARNKESINNDWKKALLKWKAKKVTPVNKDFTIEDYFLSRDDPSK